MNPDWVNLLTKFWAEILFSVVEETKLNPNRDTNSSFYLGVHKNKQDELSKYLPGTEFVLQNRSWIFHHPNIHTADRKILFLLISCHSIQVHSMPEFDSWMQDPHHYTQSYISQVLWKLMWAMYLFCFLSDWADRAVLKNSAILLKFTTFKVFS